MKAFNSIELTIDGTVATVALNRPEARNAVNLAMARELDAALTSVEEDPTVTVVILTGNGLAFCAGADLKALAAGEPEASVGEHGWAAITHRNRSKILIAAVEGAAVAGGCELVLAADLAVASRNATFGLPEAKRGLIAAAGGATRLPHLIPPRVAMELLLTGDSIDADRAFELGLINRVVSPGEARKSATELANEIAANAPLAVRATRRLIAVSMSSGVDSADELSHELLADLMDTEDVAEGLAAFAERRAPRWSGR
jgi:enoyl-CoA hydratase/carnithine racemase